MAGPERVGHADEPRPHTTPERGAARIPAYPGIDWADVLPDALVRRKAVQRAVDAAVSDRAFLKALDDQAPPPNRRARDTAIATALALADWDIPLPQSVEPSAIGGLALWYQKGTDYVLVECDNDGDITLFFHDERDGEGTVLVGHAGATLISVTLAVRRLLRI